MCFGGSPKMPDIPQALTATPTPAAVPTPAAKPGEVAASAESKRKKLDALKYGAMGTVRNVGGAAGVSGTGVDLSNPMASQKKTLGG